MPKAQVCSPVCRKCGDQASWQDLRILEGKVVIPEHIFFHVIEKKQLWDIASTALYPSIDIHIYTNKNYFNIAEILNYLVANSQDLPLPQDIDHRFKGMLVKSMAQKGGIFQRIKRETYRLLPNVKTTKDAEDTAIPEEYNEIVQPPNARRRTFHKKSLRRNSSRAVPSQTEVEIEEQPQGTRSTRVPTLSPSPEPEPLPERKSKKMRARQKKDTFARESDDENKSEERDKNGEEEYKDADEDDDIATLICNWCKRDVMCDIRKLRILNPKTEIVIVPSIYDDAYTFACADCNMGKCELRHDRKTWKQVAFTAISNMERLHGRQFFPYAEVIRFIDSNFLQVCVGLKYVPQWPSFLTIIVRRGTDSQLCVTGAGDDECWGLRDENNQKPPPHDTLTVEKILCYKQIRKKDSRPYMYLVKWEGFSETWATWEKKSSLPENILAAWKEKQQQSDSIKDKQKTLKETQEYTVFDIVRQKCTEADSIFAKGSEISPFSNVREGPTTRLKKTANNNNNNDDSSSDAGGNYHTTTKINQEVEEVNEEPSRGQNLSKRRKKRKAKEDSETESIDSPAVLGAEISPIVPEAEVSDNVNGNEQNELKNQPKRKSDWEWSPPPGTPLDEALLLNDTSPVLRTALCKTPSPSASPFFPPVSPVLPKPASISSTSYSGHVNPAVHTFPIKTEQSPPIANANYKITSHHCSPASESELAVRVSTKATTKKESPVSEKIEKPPTKRQKTQADANTPPSKVLDALPALTSVPVSSTPASTPSPAPATVPTSAPAPVPSASTPASVPPEPATVPESVIASVSKPMMESKPSTIHSPNTHLAPSVTAPSTSSPIPTPTPPIVKATAARPPPHTSKKTAPRTPINKSIPLVGFSSDFSRQGTRLFPYISNTTSSTPPPPSTSIPSTAGPPVTSIPTPSAPIPNTTSPILPPQYLYPQSPPLPYPPSAYPLSYSPFANYPPPTSPPATDLPIPSGDNSLVLSNFQEPHMIADVFVFWENAAAPSGFVRCSLTSTLKDLRMAIVEDEVTTLTQTDAFVYFEAPVRAKQEAKVYVGECTSVCPETQRRTVILRKDGNKL